MSGSESGDVKSISDDLLPAVEADEDRIPNSQWRPASDPRYEFKAGIDVEMEDFVGEDRIETSPKSDYPK
jgi:hypothetical protein